MTARVEGVGFTVLFFGYIWLVFEGGLADFIGEALKPVPHPFGTCNGIAIIFGIAVLIGYRAIYGVSWFKSFNASSSEAAIHPYRSVFKGLALYFGVINANILIFWAVWAMSV